jgi:hypothetical protein
MVTVLTLKRPRQLLALAVKEFRLLVGLTQSPTMQKIIPHFKCKDCHTCKTIERWDMTNQHPGPNGSLFLGTYADQYLGTVHYYNMNP